MSFNNAAVALSAMAVTLMLTAAALAQQAPSGQQTPTTQQPSTQQPPATPPQPPPKPSNVFSPQGRTFGPDNGANIRP